MSADQNSNSPTSAIILAAGLGTRMRPITLTKPKPLVEVSGKAMLDHCLEALTASQVENCVINVHYLPDQIITHVADIRRPKIVISDERDALLDSGGGVKKALPHLGNEPFFLLNADSFWIDGDTRNLDQMAIAFDPATMDIMLLVAEPINAVGFHGKGDFFMDEKGRLTRRGDAPSAPHIYAGAAILRPEIFTDTPDGAFSLNTLFNRAIEQGRLIGHPLDGLWLHVGTPEAVGEAEDAIAKYRDKA